MPRMLTTDRVAGGALFAIGVFVICESLLSRRRLPLGTLHTPGPAYVPVVLALLLVVFGLVVVLLGARAPRLASVGWREWRHAAGIFVACAFCAFALERLGYRLTMTFAVLALLAVVERRGLLFSVLFAVGLAFGTFFLFDTVLRTPLPRGAFGF
jgi:hypothetical protein